MSETEEIIEAIIPLAVRWKKATDRSLGITGEVGEHLACKLMGWSLAVHLQAGWDATDTQGNRIQIKSRVLQNDRDLSPTMGTLDLRKEWDQAALVVMNDHFQVQAIWLAEGQAARVSQDKCRNPRGEAKGLAIKAFKKISRQVWPKQRDVPPPPGPPANCSELANELRRQWRLGLEKGHGKAMLVVFGAVHSSKLGMHCQCKVDPLVKKAGLKKSAGLAIRLGMSIAPYVRRRDQDLPELPPIKCMSSIFQLGDELRQMRSDPRYQDKKTQKNKQTDLFESSVDGLSDFTNKIRL